MRPGAMLRPALTVARILTAPNKSHFDNAHFGALAEALVEAGSSDCDGHQQIASIKDQCDSDSVPGEGCEA